MSEAWIKNFCLVGLAVLGVAVSFLLLEASSSSKATSRPTLIGIGEREFSIAVYRPKVRAGRVRFNIRNYGEDVHDLVVLSAKGSRVAASQPIRPGGTYSFEAALKKGRYRLICTEADHLQRGMRATLSVTSKRSAKKPR